MESMGLYRLQFCFGRSKTHKLLRNNRALEEIMQGELQLMDKVTHWLLD